VGRYSWLRRLAITGALFVSALICYQLATARIAAAAAPAAEVIAQPPEDISADDNLLILKLTLSGLTLSESLLGNQLPDSICLYFSDLVRALDFPIEVIPQERRAEGWFLSESRTFQLTADSVTIAGEAVAFDPKRVTLLPEDLSST